MNDLDLSRGLYRKVYAGFIWGKRINSVSLEAEAWFWRLNAIADDYGNMPGEADRLHRETSGRRRVSAEQVAAWVKELVSTNLLRPYTASGDDFLNIPGFVILQPSGAKNGRRVRRYPESPWDRGEVVNAGESGCAPVDPGVSGGARKILTPQYQCQDQCQDHRHRQAKPEPVAPASAASADSAWTGDQRAVLDYLALAEVGRLKATELTMAGLTLADARRVNDARKQAGKPADGKFIAQLKAAAVAGTIRAGRRAAMTGGSNG